MEKHKAIGQNGSNREIKPSKENEKLSDFQQNVKVITFCSGKLGEVKLG